VEDSSIASAMMEDSGEGTPMMEASGRECTNDGGLQHWYTYDGGLIRTQHARLYLTNLKSGDQTEKWEDLCVVAGVGGSCFVELV
jgi:hypothetical protein